MKKGFTLIELLIVVAIIAILAAIAVPNFLEAQTRAKISRGKADMRTVATALETYRIDNNVYPVDGQSPIGQQHYLNTAKTIQQAFGSARLNNMLTTPISYLNGASIYDTFIPPNPDQTLVTLRYVDFKGTYMTNKGITPNPSAYAAYAGYAGDWQLLSAGPDKSASVTDPYLKPTPRFWIVTPYEATNGTVSKGDIVRTQKNGEGYVY